MSFRNNFDLLRFLLASTVVLFHLRALTGCPAFEVFRWADGEAAVLGFFAISGYVVTLSFERSKTWKRYVSHRARRLLPAYYAVVVFAWVAGAWVSTLPPGAYWRDLVTWKYLGAQLVFAQFVQPSLPGLFTGNPALTAVNGSLWSIRTEIFCYALLPLVLMSRARFWAAGLSIALSTGLAFYQAPVIQTAISRPIECFMLGACVASPAFPRGVLRWSGIAGAVAVALVIAGSWPDFFNGPLWRGPLGPAATSCAVLAAALELPYLGSWPFLGNVSYGVYLWHFPLIQWATSRGWFAAQPWPGAAAVLALVMMFATASWYVVERPVISHGRRAD